jgi:hypothetical protein
LIVIFPANGQSELLVVQVVDSESGMPVENAFVNFLGYDKGYPDRRGEYHFFLKTKNWHITPGKDVKLHVYADGYDIYSTVIRVGNDLSSNYFFAPLVKNTNSAKQEVSVIGQIKDKKTDNFIKGVIISYKGKESVVYSVSADDGIFQLNIRESNLRNDELLLTFVNEAYNSFDTIVIFKKNHQIPPLNILLSKIEYAPEQLFLVRGIIKPNYRANVSKNNFEIVVIGIIGVSVLPMVFEVLRSRMKK